MNMQIDTKLVLPQESRKGKSTEPLPDWTEFVVSQSPQLTEL